MNISNQLTLTAQNPFSVNGFPSIIDNERGGIQARSFYFAVGFVRRLLSFASGMGWTKVCGVCGRARHQSHFRPGSGGPGKKPVCDVCRSKGKKS